MKNFQAIPLAIGAVAFAGITTVAQESKVETPTLSATDKIEIIETIEVTSEKELDSSSSEELDEDVAAILKEAEADAQAIDSEVNTLKKTIVRSNDEKSTLAKDVDRVFVELKKSTTSKAVDSTESKGKSKLMKSKSLKLEKTSK